MKVIFLDIDGVLNSRTSIMKNKNEIRFRDNPDIMHIQWLNLIVEKTNAKVVISSTWRTFAETTMFNRFLALLGFRGTIIGKTPNLDTFRGTEIKAWLLAHADQAVKYKDSTWYPFKEEVESFVILDDDNDMLDLTPQLVRTDCLEGLTEADALKAIEILNREE